MPSDTGKDKLTAQRALYVACCLLGPTAAASSFLFLALGIWQASGKWAATGGLALALALVCWVVGYAAESTDIYHLRKRIRELEHR